MLPKKKLLRFLLCAQLITTYSYTFTSSCDPQSVIDLAHISDKLKAIISFVYDAMQPEERTNDLKDIYHAIQENKSILSRAITEKVMLDIIEFIEDHKNCFVHANDFDIISSYVKVQFQNIHNGSQILELTRTKRSHKGNHLEIPYEKFIHILHQARENIGN